MAIEIPQLSRKKNVIFLPDFLLNGPWLPYLSKHQGVQATFPSDHSSSARTSHRSHGPPQRSGPPRSDEIMGSSAHELLFTVVALVKVDQRWHMLLHKMLVDAGKAS